MPSTYLAQGSSCILCGTEMARRPVGDTDLLLCASCGMGRVPGMSVASDYWKTDSPAEVEFSNQYWTTARSKMFRTALAHLDTGGNRGRLMDIGGGVGYFVECALQQGWDAYSVDISEQARKVAAERLGEERSLSPEEAEAYAGTCDVVTLWCVIAHVTDPVDLLTRAVHLLKPGGRLLVTTPNFIFQGSLAKLLARLDRPYDIVCRDHILHFTPRAAGRLLRKAGLQSWSFEYLGVTENCFFSQRFARVLVPLKRIWNYLGSRADRIGLPPLSAELQIIAVTAGMPAEDSLPSSARN